MHQFLDVSKNLELWDETIKIYNDSFPEWEREDTANILKNVQTGVYKMVSYVEEDEVIGFYILDVNDSLRYALFSFLAIKESKRGLGIGSKLCLNAIDYFHSHIKAEWLLIEAEERQAKLYKKLGFRKINIDYRIPKFNSNESVPMNLMLIQEKNINADVLSRIIKDVFRRGYSLEEDDVRIEEQLQRMRQREI